MLGLQDEGLLRRYAAKGQGYVFPTNGIPIETLIVCVCIIVVYIASLFNGNIRSDMALKPDSLFHISELPRLSSYVWVHSGFFHLFFNVLSLWAPLAEFERTNGTFHTALVLSILATAVAIPYCLLGTLFFPNTVVLGASGWVFSLISYFSYLNSLSHRTVKLFNSWEVPTLSIPFIFMLTVFLMVPNSSLIGHFLGIVTGFLLAKGWFINLTVLPFGLMEKIEGRLSRLIDHLPGIFNYVRESSVKSSRYQYSSTALPLYTQDENLSSRPLRLSTDESSHEDNAGPFIGTGHVLGSNI